MLDILKKLTILYAEDEEDSRKNYTLVLEKYFHSVYQASDGEEAKLIYEQKRPNILLLDVYMPKMSGLELASEIRKNDKETKIVILSAHSDSDKLFQAIKLQLVDYLVKPVSRGRLKEVLWKIATDFSDKLDDIIYLKENFLWDSKIKVLKCSDNIISLTKQEVRFLDILISRKGKVFKNSDIFYHIWEDDFDKEYSADSIKTLVKNIRKKLPKDIIKNVYGDGYRINPDFL